MKSALWAWRTLALTAFALFASACATASAPAAFKDCADCPAMRVVPAGSFNMGEAPSAHVVTFAAPFAVAAHEVTLGEFRAFVEATGHQSPGPCQHYEGGNGWERDAARNWRAPGYAQEDNHPVVCVTWRDATAYAAWLATRTGKPYRLMSEAEWENISATDGIDSGVNGSGITHDIANIGKTECCGPETGGRDIWARTAPVGSFPADAFGLHDIHGNAFEWQADCYNENLDGVPSDGAVRVSGCSHPEWRVVRGGSWGDAGEFQATTFRLRGRETDSYFTLGFRVARDLDADR